MSMSLDGLIAGPADEVGNGLGNNGHRLHAWLSDSSEGTARDEAAGDRVPAGPSGVNGEVYAELMATGAVVVGRRTFEMAGEWNGNHHDGVPIVVLTRRAGDTPRWPLVTYVDDIADAMARAKAAAGDKDVLVHGAKVAQLALAAGVLDELEIHLIPVLLGQGRRLFDGLGPEHIELKPTRVIDAPGVTHLRYRVRR
jgi:dihydrofolate reductase